jgi:hypothetical protein
VSDHSDGTAHEFEVREEICAVCGIARGRAAVSAEWEDTRPVLMSKVLMDTMALRTNEGYRLTWDWGEPDEDGFYIPVVTTHPDDNIAEQATHAALAAVRERVLGHRIFDDEAEEVMAAILDELDR